jgi:uncharacterized protein YgbK (DUF1537 family)
MLKMAIIADDLTGATDSGLQLARLGNPAPVVFDAREIRRIDCEVAVVDTDSRSLSPRAAYQRVWEATSTVQEARPAHLFKKIDSTLRGNIGAEIDAILDVSGIRMAVVAPAFPQIGRTTLLGTHYLYGVPVHQSEIGKDPISPVSESNIAEWLKRQSQRKIGNLYKYHLEEGMDAVLQRLQDLMAEGVQLVVCDAETDRELRLLVDTVRKSGEEVLWVGSAGLAQHVAEALALHGQKTEWQPIEPTGRPVLLVAGSLSRITKRQIERLRENKQVQVVELNPLAIVRSPETRGQERERCITQVLRAVEQGRDVALVAGISLEQIRQLEVWVQSGPSHVEIARQIADELGAIAAAILEQQRLQGIILTGGDTARSVCRHSGIHGITVLREVETGIPLGTLAGKHPLPAVTKAGAFGTNEALIRALELLKGEH